KDLDFAVPTRKMKFYNLKINKISKESVECSFKCSKGSYVRSWVSMIGQKLACGATVQELCRIYSAPYSLEKATPLVELEQMVAPIWKSPSFISLENCLSDWEAVTLSGRDEKLINNGQVPSSLAKRLIFQQKIANLENKKLGIRIFQASSGTLASLLELQPMQQPKIKRVFRY
ncbi:MAG: hypothetical protein KDD40_10385, partial [Bdellovibrionales bacterium]|nr:hypothetical protein [Bdellovibrionales bacterium]